MTKGSGLLQAVGLVGVAVLLVAYALTVSGRVDARGAVALSLNGAGALMILASLWQDWNLPAVVIEVAWTAIAAVGLVRLAVSRGRARP